MRGKTILARPLKPFNHYVFPLHDLIISPHVKHPPKNFPKQFCAPMQSFFMKTFSLYFVGRDAEETLCFIFKSFPISKISSLTFVVQTMTFQAKLPSLNCKIVQLKKLNLVINLSLISNKASNLFSAIYSEIIAVSNTNLTLL